MNNMNNSFSLGTLHELPEVIHDDIEHQEDFSEDFYMGPKHDYKQT